MGELNVLQICVVAIRGGYWRLVGEQQGLNVADDAGMSRKSRSLPRNARRASASALSEAWKENARGRVSSEVHQVVGADTG